MAERKQRARSGEEPERRPRDRPDDEPEADRRRSSRANGQRRTRVPGPQAAGRAASDLLQLIGKDIEAIVGLERADDGWRVEVEVLEMRRIPSTTDVLALYQVDADDDGSLVGYKRLRRYGRGAPGQDGNGS